MTSTSDAARHAERPRADEPVCAAADQSGPRSTLRLNPWIARCVPAPPRPTTVHRHS
jgi:hypothetical protein